MRSGSDQRRNRFQRNPSSQPHTGTSQRSQNFDSHGPGDRVRGNAAQVCEHYLVLAREAARSDDRVTSENYYQHAEHYFRIGNAGRDGNPAAASPLADQATVEMGLAPTESSAIEEPVISAPEHDRFSHA
jgi:hypothetical protein